MGNLVAGAVFRLVQVVLAPFAFVGYILFVAKIVRYSRRSGVSATALAPLYTRWMQHQLGTRPDEACARLMRGLPNVSRLGLLLVTGPTRAAHRLTGYVPPLYRYPFAGRAQMSHQPAARTTFFDAALERHLGRIEQFVILGAGWDTRAYRLPPGARVGVFEIDAPKTQALKRATLARAGLDTDRVTFVATDFLKEDWFEKLVQAGFAPDRPCFFLWEGVTMYLDRPSVERTLRTIAGTAPGSVVAFDYFSTQLIEGRTPGMRYVTAVIKATSEPFRFGIESTPPARERVAAFLAGCGLTLEDQRNFGSESEHRHAQAGFAAGVVPAR